jgi:DNA-binding MarR family transcriptional regulator
MEAAGLLRREPHPDDRRLVRLVLTDRALATFSPAERAALIQALADIRHNLTD